MRITKKMLKEMRREVRNHFLLLSAKQAEGEEALRQEHRKRFPFREEMLRPALTQGLMIELVDGVLEKIIPDHYID